MLIFIPEDGGSMFVGNVGIHLKIHMQDSSDRMSSNVIKSTLKKQHIKLLAVFDAGHWTNTNTSSASDILKVLIFSASISYS